MFSRNAALRLNEIIKRYPTPRSAVLPALFIAQNEYGWLSPEALDAVSSVLDMPKATVKGVATFHTMFRNRPGGRHLIQLCSNIACMIFGAESLLELLEERFGLKQDGTSSDGRFSLAVMECIGACDTPPAMMVNNDFHTNLTAGSIMRILDGYK
jgi:NADH-quinone oxidoreductase E subunit